MSNNKLYLKPGINFTASDMAGLLMEYDKNKQGINVWKNAYSQVENTFLAESRRAQDYYSNLTAEAYTASREKERNIMGSQLSIKSTDDLLRFNRKDLEQTYDTFMANYGDRLADLIDQRMSAQEGITQELLSRSGNMAKVMTSTYDYFLKEFSKGKIYENDVEKNDLISDAGLDWLYKELNPAEKAAGVKPRFKTQFEAMHEMFDEQERMTNKGEQFYRAMMHYPAAQGYMRENDDGDYESVRDFAKWLADTNEELSDWYLSAGPNEKANYETIRDLLNVKDGYSYDYTEQYMANRLREKKSNEGLSDLEIAYEEKLNYEKAITSGLLKEGEISKDDYENKRIVHDLKKSDLKGVGGDEIDSKRMIKARSSVKSIYGKDIVKAINELDISYKEFKSLYPHIDISKVRYEDYRNGRFDTRDFNFEGLKESSPETYDLYSKLISGKKDDVDFSDKEYERFRGTFNLTDNEISMGLLKYLFPEMNDKVRMGIQDKALDNIYTDVYEKEKYQVLNWAYEKEPDTWRDGSDGMKFSVFKLRARGDMVWNENWGQSSVVGSKRKEYKQNDKEYLNAGAPIAIVLGDKDMSYTELTVSAVAKSQGFRETLSEKYKNKIGSDAPVGTIVQYDGKMWFKNAGGNGHKWMHIAGKRSFGAVDETDWGIVKKAAIKLD